MICKSIYRSSPKVDLEFIKSKFWVRHFFSIATFKQIADIPLPNNLFVSFNNKLFISLVEQKNIHKKNAGDESKIDKITYSKRNAEQRNALPKISLQCTLKSRFSFGGILTSLMFICLSKKWYNFTKVKKISGTDVIIYLQEKI